MNTQELAELAHLYATEGLVGEQLEAFEAWRAIASAEEKAEFAALVDSIAVTTLAHVPEVAPPGGLKARIVDRVQEASKKEDTPLLPVAEAFSYVAKNEGEWVPLPFPGARIKELSARKEDGVTVFVLEMDPDTRFPSHQHHGAEMAYVLEGDLHTEDRVLHAGDFARAESDTEHGTLYSKGGCRALLITASENYPRVTVTAMKKLRNVVHAARDLLRGKSK